MGFVGSLYIHVGLQCPRFCSPWAGLLFPRRSRGVDPTAVRIVDVVVDVDVSGADDAAAMTIINQVKVFVC